MLFGDIYRRGVETVAEVVQVDWLGGEEGRERQMLLLFASPSGGSEGDAVDKTFNHALEAVVPDLKTALDNLLPAYLQPEAIVPLAHIPKTSSGKTHRGHLRETGKKLRPQQLIWLSGNSASNPSSLAPPCTHEEQTMATLWAKVLGLEAGSISREDDFFRLGGDSLAVMRLATAAHEVGVTFKAADVFRSSACRS